MKCFFPLQDVKLPLYLSVMKTRWIQTTPHNPWKPRYKLDKLSGPANITFGDASDFKWEGFGGCFNELGWHAMRNLSEDQRESVLRDLFSPEDGCAFTFCRVPIGASDYGLDWYSLNETKEDFEQKHFSIDRDRRTLIPYIKLAQRFQPELTLHASPWSPPTWMKRPPVYNHGRFIMEKRYLESYALYFARFVQDYSLAGIPITQIHVQNEPAADHKFPSCEWSGKQMGQFIRDHLGPTFIRENIDAEIWLGTLNTDNFDHYVAPVLFDEAASRYVAGVGYQWAGKGALPRTRKAFPNLRIMQTENECGDGNNDWNYAAYVFNLFQHYITHDVCAYTYWNMVLQPGGSSTWGWKQNSLFTVCPDTNDIQKTPEYHIMRHFSQYIKPGARRVDVNGAWGSKSVAFRNPDDSLVLVLHNTLSEVRDIHVANGEQGFSAKLEPNSFHTFVLSS